jgi:hypothetical protein
VIPILERFPATLLPALAAVLLLSAAPPARAQFLYLDVNGDGLSDSGDVLNSAVTSVDVYLDTSHTRDGKLVTCAVNEDAAHPEALTISSYTFILGWSPGVGGSLTYGVWTDNVGFAIAAGGAQGERDFWIARAAPHYLAPGKYRLGTLAVTVKGTPILQLLASTPIDATALTSFGSACLGQDFDNTIKLGSDFTDARGTSPADDGPRTTWRTIEALYR